MAGGAPSGDDNANPDQTRTANGDEGAIDGLTESRGLSGLLINSLGQCQNLGVVHDVTLEHRRQHDVGIDKKPGNVVLQACTSRTLGCGGLGLRLRLLIQRSEVIVQRDDLGSLWSIFSHSLALLTDCTSGILG